MRQITVFIASPGDVQQERDSVRSVIEELDRIFGKRLDCSIKSVMWEKDTFPDIGDDAQDVINKQIGDYDALVGIMWKRFGTPTKRAESGTDEEFTKAFDLHQKFDKPKVLFYFRETPFFPHEERELGQMRKVMRFRKRLGREGVYYATYPDPPDFERQVREHLAKHVLEMFDLQLPKQAGGRPRRSSGKRELSKSRIDETSLNVLLVTNQADGEVRAILNQIYDEIRALGHEPWMSHRDLQPGQNPVHHLAEKVETADAIIFSPMSTLAFEQFMRFAGARRSLDYANMLGIQLDYDKEAPIVPNTVVVTGVYFVDSFAMRKIKEFLHDVQRRKSAAKTTEKPKSK